MIRSNSGPVHWQDITKVALLPAILLLFAASSAFGAVQYAITDLGTLGGYATSEAYGINDSGQVVGSSRTSDGGNEHAFLYSGSGPMQDLGTLGGIASVAHAINNSGLIVGGAWTPASDAHAFLYNGSGPMQDLTTSTGRDRAWGINDSGQVVGSAWNDQGDSYAFRTSPNSPINPATDNLGTLGGSVSWANGINNSGQVVGFAYTSVGSYNYHAFLYSGSGPMQDLGTLGSGLSEAKDINNGGQIVGVAIPNGTGNTERAFLYSGNGPMQDLNNLTSPSSGWTLSTATAINEKGQIVGYGRNPAGQTHAFVLSPLSTITTTTGAPPNTLSDALKPVNPTVTPPSGHLKRWNGSSWQSVNSWTNSGIDPNGIDPNQPTVVIAHGWGGSINGSIVAPTFVSSLADALYQQNDNANILGWDWTDGAAVVIPGQITLPGWAGQLQDVRAEGLAGVLRSAQNGAIEGVSLARELQDLQISNDKLQLIGHSNGGAVVGAAATQLALSGQVVKRVTALDTPNLKTLREVPGAGTLVGSDTSPLLDTSVNAMKYITPASATHVEVYYSGPPGDAGRAALGFGAPLETSNTNVFNGQIAAGWPFPLSANPDHLRILDWYTQAGIGVTPAPDEFAAGIVWSILSPHADDFTAVDAAEQPNLFQKGVFKTTSFTVPASVNLAKRSVDGFENNTSWSGEHAELVMRDPGNAAARITYGSDGYLWTDVSVPGDAYYLTFDLKIETLGAGDFLTVTLGNELIFYKALNAADSDFWTVDPIFIGDFAGQTDTLLFTLNHVGTGTPSLLLDNITFSALPALPGDFNGDNSVDAADYVVWRKTGGTQEEYNLWRTHFGQTVNPAAAADSFNQAIPEPESLALLLLGTTALCMFPRPGLAAKNRC